jgi:hypothetical protein
LIRIGDKNHEQFEEQISAAVAKGLPYLEFAETLVENTRILAGIEIEEILDWFQEIRDTPVTYIQMRNQALAPFIQSNNPKDSETMQEHR